MKSGEPVVAGERMPPQAGHKRNQRAASNERLRTSGYDGSAAWQKSPDRPPDLESNRIGPISIPRSIALHMS